LLIFFNAWFLEILTSKKFGRWPIIGDVDGNLFEKIGDPQFDEVQIYLIEKYFTHKMGLEKVIQVSLAVIQYWYGNYYPYIFIKFKEYYWKEMIEALGEKLLRNGGYSLTKFDSDGNYVGRKDFRIKM
jgi:hypothetical protein